jgi:type VI secretion system secreted protein VgrG
MTGERDGQHTSRTIELFFDCESIPEITWRVRRASFVEKLNASYSLQLGLATDAPDAEPMRLLGQSCRLTMRRGASERYVTGIVTELRQGSTQTDAITTNVVVEPALESLRPRINTRIFQDVTVPEILARILGEGLAPLGRTLSMSLERDYERQEHRTQYDESDLDFCHRLIQEEGLLYWFEFDGTAERMILADHHAGYGRIESLDDKLLLFSDYEDGSSEHEYVNELLMRSVQSPSQEHAHLFDWASSSIVVGDDSAEPDETIAIAQTSGASVAEGLSTVMGMSIARSFELFGHPQPDLDGNYLVLHVEHGFDEGGSRYQNRFRCIPAGVPFRPRLSRAKPKIHSVQLARVVGPEGESIHVDALARVQVRFEWDLHGRGDDLRSSWVRVAQPWAGAGAGTLFLPRVGSEVIVSFINGDPDRPLITGAVYGADNPPPLTLPEERTKTTIRSLSMPGAERSSEISFDDRVGGEQLAIHAGHDLNQTVEHNSMSLVYGNRNSQVQGDQSETIGGDRSLSVRGWRSVTVGSSNRLVIGGSQRVAIGGSEDVDGVTGAALDVSGDYRLDASGLVEIRAPAGIKLSSGDAAILIVDGKITLTSGQGASLTLDAEALLGSLQGGDLRVNGAILARSSQGSQIRLDADAALQGASEVRVTAPRAKVEGSATAEMTGGVGSVKADPGGVTVAGPKGSVKVDPGGLNVSGSKVSIR